MWCTYLQFALYFSPVQVNNAGIVQYGTIIDAPIDQYDVLMTSNLKSAVMLTKHFVPYLIKSKGSGALSLVWNIRVYTFDL